MTSFSWEEKIRKPNNFWWSWRKHHVWWYFSIRGTEYIFFFKNATKTLNINENWYIVHSSSSITDPVYMAVKTYKNLYTILLMKQKLENVGHFSFKEVSISEIEKEYKEPNSYKVTTFGNILTKILNKIVKVVLIHYKNSLMTH